MPEKDLKDKVTAALVIIGNEILSGRTQDANTSWIADKMIKHGIALQEVRIVTDIETTIVKAVNELRTEVDYVFTTGGIGPTHDDITAESIAAAFNVPFEEHEEARKILRDYYGAEELTDTRLRMAKMPRGATLIPNPVSGAPGFVIENVHVMAGVPRIMQGMLESVIGNLKGGAPVLSNSVVYALPESKIADQLGALQARYADVEIGSYPQYRDGKFAVNVVLRSSDKEALKQSTRDMIVMLRDMDQEPTAMSFQATP